MSCYLNITIKQQLKTMVKIKSYSDGELSRIRPIRSDEEISSTMSADGPWGSLSEAIRSIMEFIKELCQGIWNGGYVAGLGYIPSEMYNQQGQGSDLSKTYSPKEDFDFDEYWNSFSSDLHLNISSEFYNLRTGEWGSSSSEPSGGSITLESQLRELFTINQTECQTNIHIGSFSCLLKYTVTESKYTVYYNFMIMKLNEESKRVLERTTFEVECTGPSVNTIRRVIADLPPGTVLSSSPITSGTSFEIRPDEVLTFKLYISCNWEVTDLTL